MQQRWKITYVNGNVGFHLSNNDTAFQSTVWEIAVSKCVTVVQTHLHRLVIAPEVIQSYKTPKTM